MKVEKELSLVVTQTKKDIESDIATLKDDFDLKVQTEISDKVKVEEVQDALRRLTDNYQHKIETIY